MKLEADCQTRAWYSRPRRRALARRLSGMRPAQAAALRDGIREQKESRRSSADCGLISIRQRIATSGARSWRMWHVVSTPFDIRRIGQRLLPSEIVGADGREDEILRRDRRAMEPAQERQLA